MIFQDKTGKSKNQTFFELVIAFQTVTVKFQSLDMIKLRLKCQERPDLQSRRLDLQGLSFLMCCGGGAIFSELFRIL